MRQVVLAALWTLTGSVALAANVSITCTISSGDTFIGPNMMPAAVDGPWNFTITPEGLQTSWGADCGLMKGVVSLQAVSVSCGGELPGSVATAYERAVQIDRQLGTYSERTKMTDRNGTVVTVKHGICKKRETF